MATALTLENTPTASIWVTKLEGRSIPKSRPEPTTRGHYSHNALVPAPTFVKGPALHQKLRGQLHNPTPDEKRTQRIVVVHGAGGAGKSQLVSNYVQEYRSDYAAVFWLEAAMKVG
ncbi:hypothetical protein EPUS_00836 [Endocarpon pusillum Z07020]|uniref:NB-ARC domain-containing protein n=1 Tax=Endocarpon pusillum (strain Z07020 / HMAS-L-300199) TaxID=1263415 RepID=U1GRU9_ENDPU|nr:uncharacterized protein EPUS_00836 [Endocarpon pusillum Z07020]ERF74706.1 hypothetical protein EPUS_00836 [Endocarpon pusillum Z07020]